MDLAGEVNLTNGDDLILKVGMPILQENKPANASF